LRVISGEIGGQAGPGSTHTPISLMHASITPGSVVELPWPVAFNSLAYVLAGSGEAGPERRPVRTGQLVAFRPGEWLTIRASAKQDSRSENLEVLLLGGEPIGEHVEHYGPFVMNTKAEIGQAVEDFEAGRLGRIPPNALMPHVPDPAPARTDQTGI
jgi:quercetin 2,3-dioxygenase